MQWLALDLGPGELAAMALAFENPDRVVLLDDLLARRTAQAAGLTVWGTLKVLLEAKAEGLIDQVGPLLVQLEASGMWLSAEIRQRILLLAGESCVPPDWSHVHLGIQPLTKSSGYRLAAADTRFLLIHPPAAERR